ncbi:MAG: riboflavin synthase subunit alpha [Pseudomonadales bacterium]|nr:riboflavin synthase subunit alpha [Pseudomonadales bacterium]
MFTGIIQSIATIDKISDSNGLRTFQIKFASGFCQGLEIGASVSVDGVCLTVTTLLSDNRASFDVMLQSLLVTTLSDYSAGIEVNVERAARDGAEIGGHPLSGHIDFHTPVADITLMQDNYRLRICVSKQWLRYIFPKGYIAINGASLTIANVDKKAGWFEVWLIPETLRMTVFKDKGVGQHLNIEIERGTQVVVDTVRDTLEENLGKLYPLLQQLLEQQGIDINSLASENLAVELTKKSKSEDK